MSAFSFVVQAMVTAVLVIFDVRILEIIGGVVSLVTVSVNGLVFVTPLAAPEIVTVYVPTVALPLAVKVSVLLHGVDVGEQEVGENVPVTPAGNPDVLNITDCVVPDTNDTFTLLVTEAPCATLRAPPFAILKSKVGVGGGVIFVRKSSALQPSTPAS